MFRALSAPQQPPTIPVAERFLIQPKLNLKANDFMQLRNFLVYTLAVLTPPVLGTVAPAANDRCDEDDDYPGDGNATLPQKISDQGDMVGTVIYSTGVRQGF